ncbi:uncharacterized protein CBL_10324 [Carabus blaptoides fortunei]
MASAGYSEDELGRRWDRCMTDGVLKLGGGALVGTVLSLLFFKRRKWPIIMGSGFGIGMAYKNCENQLNETVGCKKRRV